MARPRADRNLTSEFLSKQISTVLLDPKNMKDFKLSITKLSHVERVRTYMSFFKIVIDAEKKEGRTDDKLKDAITLLKAIEKGVE